MSAQEGFHHPCCRSPYDASLHRIERALRTYGVLTEERLLEVCCDRGTGRTRATLQSALRAGAVRRVGDVYALPRRTR